MDSRYVIQLLVEASDRTGAGLQKAISNLAKLESAEKSAQEAATKFGNEAEAANRKVEKSAQRLGASKSEVKGLFDAWNAGSRTTLDTQQKLDSATRKHVQTLEQYGKESRQAAAAQDDLNKAQKEVIDAINRDNKARDENSKLRAAEEALAIRYAAAKSERAKIDKKNAQDAVKTEAAINRQREAEQKRLDDALRKMDERGQKAADEAVKRYEDREKHRQKVLAASTKAKAAELAQQEKDEAAMHEALRKMDERGAKDAEADVRKYENRARQISATRARLDREAKVAADAESARQRNYQALLREVLKSERAATIGRQQGADEPIQQTLDLNATKFRAQLHEIVGVIRDVDGEEINVDADLDAARFLAEAKVVKREIKDIERTSSGASGVLGVFKKSFDSFGESVGNSTSRIAGFDNLLRGLMTLGFTVFLQQIVQIGGAAVGMLTALAASAVQAGAAIGGALVAGITQAIPVLGIFAVVASRVKGVLEAVKQANLLEQQQSYKGAQASNQQAKSMETVRRAQEGLTKARRDAVRQIQDLILAERAAELAAQGAALSQEDAQKALQAAIASGGDVERAQLNVRSANLDVDQADRSVVKARRARVEGADPENTEGVRNAKRALRDARQSAEQVADSVSAAKGKLDFLLAGMSASEVALYKAMTRLQTRFREFGKDVSGPVIDQFTRMVNFATDALSDPKIVGASKDLSKSIAGSLGGIFDSFTDPKTINQFLGFAKEAQRNLKPVEEIIKDAGHAFLNLGTLAAPTLRRILGLLKDVVRYFRDFTESKSGQSQIRTFLHDGVEALKDWGRLLFNVVRLFLAISGAGGAETGTKAVKDMGTAIGKAADEINEKGSKARKFFEDFFKTSREVADALKPIFVALADEFRKTFGDNTKKSVEGFASIFADVIIPAVGKFVRLVGEATTAVGNFIKEHPGLGKMLGSLLGIGLLFGTMSKLAVVFAPLTAVFKVLKTLVEGLAGHFGGLSRILPGIAGQFTKLGGVMGLFRTLGPLVARIGGFFLGPVGIITLVLLVLAKLGLLDNLLKAVGGFFTAMWDEIRPSLDGFFDSIKNLWDAVSEGKGVFGVIKDAIGGAGDVLEPVLKIIIDLAGELLKAFGGGLGKTIAGFFDILGGAIDVIVGLLTGDWEGALDGAKKILLGFLDLFTGIPQEMGKLALKAGEAVLDGFVDGMGAMAGAVIGLFRGAFNAVLQWFGIRSPSTKARGWGKAVVDGFVDGLRAIGRFVGGIFQSAADRIWEVIKSVGSFGKKVASLFREGLRREVQGFKNIGTWIWNSLSDAVHNIGGKLESLGTRIINAIIKGVKAAPKAIHDAIEFLLDKAGPAGGAARKILNAVTPGDGYAEGGPVPGSGSGDTVAAWLTPGEHVFTKREVRAAGGHAAMFALRRMLGGGTQGGPFAFAPGGAVYDPRMDAYHGGGVSGTVLLQQQRNQETTERKKALETEREDYKQSNSQRAVDWRVMWNDMLVTTRRATNDIQAQIREMRVGVTATMRRLYGDVRDYVAAIQNSFVERGSSIAESWGQTFDSLQQVTFKGLTYIGHETNKVLTALGEKHIDFRLGSPSASKAGVPTSDRFKGGHLAGGGFVGNSGERGHDAVPTWLGRGEAVLNWGQQMAMNAAMRGQETVASILGRSRAFHAGGHGAPGYARGGGDLFDGHPGNVNSAIKALIDLMKGKFPLIVTSTTDHSLYTTSGNISDHTRGAAVDLSSNVAVMNRAANFVLSSGLAKRLKQAIYSGSPQLTWSGGQDVGAGYFGPAVMGQHANHLHLAITGALKGAYETAVEAGAEKIGKLTVQGAGALKDVAQGALSAVRTAANAMIAKVAGASESDGDEATLSLQGNAAGEQIFRYFKGRGFNDEQAAAWVGNFQQESGLNPAVIQPNGEGHGLAQWGGGRFAALQAFASQRDKPWQDMQTQLDFVWHELQGSERAAYGAIKSATNLNDAVNAIGVKYERYGIAGDRSGPAKEALAAYGGEFATGGIVPGGQGRPTPILAHAGEWVLNQVQQSKLARAVGTGVGNLRDYLGFTGGPTSFKNGGKVGVYDAPDVDASSAGGVLGEMRRVSQAIARIGKLTVGKALDKLMTDVDALTDETNGLFKQLNDALEARSTRMANTIALARVGFQRIGNKLKRIAPLVDAVKIAERELNALERTGADLESGRRFAAGRMTQIDRAIAAIEKGDVTKKEKDQYQALIGKRNALVKVLEKFDTDIVQNRTDQFDKATEAFRARTDAKLDKNSRAVAKNESTRSIRDTFGLDTTAQADTAKTLAKEREDILRGRLSRAKRNAASDPRWNAEADDLADQLRTAAENTASATHDALQAGIDRITKRYERRAAERDRSTRLATLKGDQATIAKDAATGIADLTSEIADTQAAALKAHKARDHGLERELLDKVKELGVQVKEKTAEMIQQAADAAEAAYNNSEARRAISGRAADLVERMGSKTGAIGMRMKISDERLGSLGTQQAAIGVQEAEARSKGLTVLADALKLKFDDLGQSIEEEIQTRKELTFQNRQAALDIITGKATRSTGLIATASDLLGKIATNAGTSYDPRALLAKAGEELAKAVPGIANNVLAGAGEFGGQAGGVLESLRSAFLSGPGDFAAKLAELGPSIADLESAMGTEQKTTFQALIDAMLGNTTSVVDNTSATKQATGALSGPQSFASSSWTMFREALFNGMGDVLPKYKVPHLASGGRITSDGLAYLHAAEVVKPAGNYADGDININMNSVNGDVDLTALAARIAFAKKNRG